MPAQIFSAFAISDAPKPFFRSPVAISQKREYFKYPPETIGEFTPGVANFGALRLIVGLGGWLGREDSNLRMVESKSTALPLGDAPIAVWKAAGLAFPRIPSGPAGL